MKGHVCKVSNEKERPLDADGSISDASVTWYVHNGPPKGTPITPFPLSPGASERGGQGDEGPYKGGN